MSMQEACSYSTWFDKCSIHYAYIVFLLHGILRFDSTVVIKLLINISCLRINNQILQKFDVYCMNILLSLPQHLKVNYFANSVTA